MDRIHRNGMVLGAVLIAVFGQWCGAWGQEPNPQPKNVEARREAPKQAEAPKTKAALGQPVIRRLMPTVTETAESAALPTDQQVIRRIHEAQRLLQDQQLSHGLALLQLVLDEPVDSYIRDGSRWMRARQKAEQMIIALGPEAWDAYQLQYGGQAEQFMQDALAARDMGRLAEVMQRFFLTPAGFQATNTLAKYQLDQGRAGLAAIYLERLIHCPVHRERISEQVQAKFTVARILSGSATDDASKSLRQPLNLGGERWTVQQLIDALSATKRTPETLSPQWHLFQGNQRRTGVASGGLPLLSPEWSFPITHDSETKSVVEETLELNDFTPNRQPTLVSVYPLVTDDLVVYRDFHSVRAVNPLTGEVKWTYPEGGSIELALKSSRIAHPSSGVSQNALLSMFVQNSVYGTLSTDGQSVFLVDQLIFNPASGNARFSGRADSTGQGGSRSCNRLTALNLQTGEPAWHAGGSEVEMDDSLADTFFFGPPLPIGNELFVVGESRSELRLICLDAGSGHVRWSQVLALSERRIDVDLFRRSLACHLAYADGILICPTNLYRIVAIDPLSRSLLWEYNFPEDKPASTRRYVSGMAVVPPPTVTYANDAPAISNGIVVATSASGGAIHGIDLQSGRRLWRVDRRNEQYLAGVYNDLALLVGGHRVRALELETGKVRWQRDIPFPSGRGVSLGEQYLLPTSEGMVVAIDMETGQIAETIRGRRDAPIGNLLVRPGQVLAAGISGVEAFPLFANIEKEVDQRLAEDARDPVGLYRRAQLRISRGDALQAVEDLRLALQQTQPPKQSLAARTLLFEIAGRELLARPELAGDLLNDLGRLASNKEQKAVYFRLLAEHRLTQNQFEEALAAVDQHAQLKLDGAVVDKTDTVRLEKQTWSRTFHRRLQAQAQQQQFPILEEFERRLTAAADTGDLAALEHMAFVLGETELGPQADLLLAERYFKQTRLSEAELSALRAANSPQESVAVKAYQLLAEISEHAGLAQDAAYFRRELRRQFPDHATQRQSEEPTDQKSGPRLYDWDFDVVDANFQTIRTYTRTTQLSPDQQPEMPYFQERDVSFNYRDFLVEVGNRQTGVREWFVPLPRGRDYNISPRFTQLGHLVLLTLQDSVYAISTLERKLLWTRKLSAGTAQDTNESAYFVVQRRSGNRFLRLDLGPSAAGYLVVRSLNDLLVLDPRTGNPLWKRRKFRRGDSVFGDGEVLFVISPDHTYTAHRTSDGEVLRKGSLESVRNSQQQTIGRRLLLFQRQGPELILSLWDAWTQEDVWAQAFDPQTRLCSSDGQYIALVSKESELTVLDRDSGLVVLRDSLPSKTGERFNLSFFSDPSNLYVAVDQQGKANIFPFNMSSSNIETQPVNGLLRAYDRATKTMIWEKELEPTRLITNPGSELPVLVSLRNQVKGGQLGTSVSIIDKRNGKVLHEEERGDYTPYSEFAYNSVEKWLELRAYNKRLRFDFLTQAEAKRQQEIKDRPTFSKLLDKLGKAVNEKLNQPPEKN